MFLAPNRGLLAGGAAAARPRPPLPRPGPRRRLGLLRVRPRNRNGFGAKGGIGIDIDAPFVYISHSRSRGLQTQTLSMRGQVPGGADNEGGGGGYTGGAAPARRGGPACGARVHRLAPDRGLQSSRPAGARRRPAMRRDGTGRLLRLLRVPRQRKGGPSRVRSAFLLFCAFVETVL